MRHIALRLAAAAAVTGIAASFAGAQSNEEIAAQIKALQARIQELEARQQTQADVEATAKRVAADAEKQSQILPPGQFQAGWDPKKEKFILGTADGAFTISPIVIWQFRGVGVYRDEPVGATSPDHTETGFENRRARFGMEGTFATPDLSYRFLWESARDGGGVSLLDAFARYKLNKDFSLKAGQFKDPWTQEENMSDAKQLAVERSALNALIGGALTDRIQGVAISYDTAKPFRAQLVLHDGGNSKNTTFVDGPTTALPPLAGEPENFGVTGRVEYFVFGTPKQYEDYSALGNKEDLLVVGAGADWTQGGSNDALFHAVDVQWENAHGTSAFVEYMGLQRSIEVGSTGASGVVAGDHYDYGFLGQVGQMLNPKWEIFGRYAWVQLDEDAFTATRTVSQDQIHEITVGANYYLWKHNAKLTVDLNYLPNGSPELPGLGYLASDADSFVLRTQLQLAL